MKKVFKALAITAATAAIGSGVAFASGCGGSDSKYIGYYAYDNYGQVYGMVVEVTVENNIITKVVDVTKSYTDDAGKGKITYTIKGETDTDVDNTDWHTCSAPWEEYFVSGYTGGWVGIVDPAKKEAYDTNGTLPTPDDCANPWTGEPVSYNWFKSDTDNWDKHEAWLLQQYEGWSVADVLDVKVNFANNGEPFGTNENNFNYNAELSASGLVIGGATQGSGRVMLAVQNALGKTVEIGRVK